MSVWLIKQRMPNGVTGHLGQNVLLSVAEQDNRDRDRAQQKTRVLETT